MSFVPGSVAAEKLGGQPASQASEERRGGGAARASSAATGHWSTSQVPSPTLPPATVCTPGPGLPWAPSQGHFSWKCCLPDPFLREDGDTKTASWGCNQGLLPEELRFLS